MGGGRFPRARSAYIPRVMRGLKIEYAKTTNAHYWAHVSCSFISYAHSNIDDLVLRSMRFAKVILCLAALTKATITFEDPSDELSPSYWTGDNALLANYWNASTDLYEYIAITGPYTYDEEDGNITRASLYENANDTSVLVVANSSEVRLSHSTVTKLGYSSDLTQAAFFGMFL